MNSKSYVAVFILVMLSMVVWGCKDENDDKNTVVNSTVSTPQLYTPKGTISGLVRDRVTNKPVAGAVISVGYDGAVHSVSSDASGAFSFANVPAGQYQIVNGTSVISGTYTLTISMTSYNAAQPNPELKYRETYYSTVTIRFTSLIGGDSVAVGGLVGSVVLGVSHLNTTIAGIVVDKNFVPVPNSSVTLYDFTVNPVVALGQTVTNNNGYYQFTGVDNGLTVQITAQSSDGNLEASLAAPFTLPANVMKDSLRNQVTAEKLVLLPVDNTSPFVTSISPEHLTDNALNSLAIVYSFSEPIKQTQYTRTDLPLGYSTILDDITINYDGLKKSSGLIGFSAQWNATYTQLTLTPQDLVGSSKYSVNFNVASNSGKLTDAAGRSLVNNTQLTGDFEVLQFTTAGNTPAPTAPVLQRRIIQGQFTELDYLGGTVGLSWSLVNGARSYNVYRSINGGSFELLQKDLYGNQLSTASGSLVTPSGASNPLNAISVRYFVKAVSKDLAEGTASNIITVSDSIRPALSSSAVAAGTGANTWLYTLRFSEPMTVANVENIVNYTFSNTGGILYTIKSANYLGFTGGTFNVLLTVTSSGAPVAGYVLTIGNGVTDLAGLSISQTANSRTF